MCAIIVFYVYFVLYIELLFGDVGLNGSLNNVRLTKLITNAVTDINGGISTGVNARYFALTSIVGVGNYYYIPYQIDDILFVSVRTFPNMDIVANTAVGNVRIYYMKR